MYNFLKQNYLPVESVIQGRNYQGGKLPYELMKMDERSKNEEINEKKPKIN